MPSKLQIPNKSQQKGNWAPKVIQANSKRLGSVGKRVANIISYQFKLGKVRYSVLKSHLLFDGIEKYNLTSGFNVSSQSPGHLDFYGNP